MHRMQCGKNVPDRVRVKAEMVLRKLEAGSLRKRKLNNGKGFTLCVGRDHRLITTGGDWRLVSHELYNKLVDRL